MAWSKRPIQGSNDPKVLFRTVDKLLNKSATSPLPSGYTSVELADRFANFFQDKILKIRSSFDPTTSHEQIQHVAIPASSSHFSCFQPVSQEEVEKIIRRAPKKSCALDPVPTWLLMDCLPEILPVLTRIINSSLCDSSVPSSLKDAIVTPLLKKSSLIS